MAKNVAEAIKIAKKIKKRRDIALPNFARW
jgi:hypothetical protein